MSEQHMECKFCGGPVEPENEYSATCDWCWYGMRMEPDEWKKRLAAVGRHPVYQGGCISGPGFAICRDPYVPETEDVREP